MNNRKRYALVGCEVLYREFCLGALRSEATIDFALLPQGLHATPGELSIRVQQEIDRLESEETLKAAAGKGSFMQAGYDSILIGLGLCSNGVAGVTARRTPLVIPRGHDCITLLLGSVAAYKEYFEKYSGTYWYSSGWIERTVVPGPDRREAVMKFYAGKYSEEKARILADAEMEQYAGYKYAGYINWNHATAARDREYTKQCAEFMGWEYIEVDGDPAMMIDFLGGNWDEERFLTVKPGQSIEPSHDDCILKICSG